MEIHLIWAEDKNGGIGCNGKLPWHIPEDLKNFKSITMDSTIIMGRKTWESLPGKLPGRRNIVMSRSIRDDIEQMNYDEVISLSEQQDVFIIGGGEIYILGFDFIDKLYITEIKANIEGDTFFPKWDSKKWKEVSRIKHPSDDKHIYEFDYVIYKRSL